MNRALLLAALAGATLLAPLADAQVAAAATLTLTPPADRLTPDGILAVGGLLTYHADLTALANLNGIPVSYTIANLPPWASAVVSPANDILPVSPQGLTMVVSRPFTLTLVGSPDMEQDANGVVEVVAVVMPQFPGSRVTTATASIPVSFDAPEKEEPCHDVPLAHVALAHPEPEATPTEEPPAEDAGTTTVQSSGATPLAVPVTASVLGFGAAGAGVGLLLRRRRA